MTESLEPTAEMESLLAAAVDGQLTEPGRARLGQMLAGSDNARESYIEHVILHAMLRWVHASPLGAETAGVNSVDSCGMANSGVWTAEDEAAMEDALPDRGDCPNFRVSENGTVPFAPVLFAPATFSQTALSAPVGGFLVSYLLAAVIVGVGILTGWVCQVPDPQTRSFVHNPPQPPPPRPLVNPEPVFVGRIIGMIDCTWANPRNAPVGFDRIALGRRYDLASGLMEIAYDSGPKVILQGPCSYKVDSASGGYLAIGMLTARIEPKAEVGRRAAEENSTARLSTQEPRMAETSSALPLPPSPLFSIRTPTATVVDLGTEFGVEVDKAGASEAHVYRGKVEMRANAEGAATGKSDRVISLAANESARVEIGKDRVAKVVREPGRPERFVRRMPRRVPIKFCSTGVGFMVDRADPRWRIVARSDDPKFIARPAIVLELNDPSRVPNRPDSSQWIGAELDKGIVPDRVTYTFRTTFDLTEMRESTALLHGRFAADNHVRAIRLNGRNVAVPAHGCFDFGFFHTFSADRGFVEGINVLEIDVENSSGEPQAGPSSSIMGLIVELDGSVLPAWPENLAAAETK